MFAFALPLLASTIAAQRPQELRERLRQASLESSLDQAGLKPWHLLLSFQLLDAQGQSMEAGTIEEWWASPSLHRIVYTSKSYNNTELLKEQGFYKASPDIFPPEMMEAVQAQTVHPMPDSEEVEGSKPDLRKLDMSKVPLDCIMLDQPLTNLAYPPLGLFPTVCLDRDKTSLRLRIDSGTIVVTHNTIGTFQGKHVATNQTISLDNLPVIKAHIEKLNTEALTSSDFQAASELVRIEETTPSIAGSVIAGNNLKKVTPFYPARAKLNHVSGTVTLGALIGRDGRVHRLKIISTPDADLAIASLVAVRQWTYKPYVLNGQRVSVDTTIKVNFSFGPG
ncbi:energy transducer TonB [Granulicella arctica]|uniref:energy transducer TonB n=1 Tax=Granulicella arctica TaxID=940613 RepID=UPI0021DFDB4C|nr:energy transducer TonB [Granulicella arctica]